MEIAAGPYGRSLRPISAAGPRGRSSGTWSSAAPPTPSNSTRTSPARFISARSISTRFLQTRLRGSSQRRFKAHRQGTEASHARARPDGWRNISGVRSREPEEPPRPHTCPRRALRRLAARLETRARDEKLAMRGALAWPRPHSGSMAPRHSLWPRALVTTTGEGPPSLNHTLTRALSQRSQAIGAASRRPAQDVSHATVPSFRATAPRLPGPLYVHAESPPAAHYLIIACRSLCARQPPRIRQRAYHPNAQGSARRGLAESPSWRS